MSAIEQVFTIGIVKDEHPRLHAEALAELAQLRAALAAAQQRAETAERELAETGNAYSAKCYTVFELQRINADLLRERDEARARVAALKASIDGLLDYRDHNTLNFQLEKADDWLDQLRAMTRAASQSATLTPRRCVTCARDAAREMRDACAELVQEFDLLYEFSKRDQNLICGRDGFIADAIRALPLPAECADCNPLKPEVNRHGCNCPCGCDAQATKQDDHGAWWCESCYLDYIGIEHDSESEATR